MNSEVTKRREEAERKYRLRVHLAEQGKRLDRISKKLEAYRELVKMID